MQKFLNMNKAMSRYSTSIQKCHEKIPIKKNIHNRFKHHFHKNNQNSHQRQYFPNFRTQLPYRKCPPEIHAEALRCATTQPQPK